MSTPEQKLINSLRTPGDIAVRNLEFILHGKSPLSISFDDEEALDDRWNNFMGSFIGSQVVVDPCFVSGGGCNIGKLGKLHIAKVEIQNTWVGSDKKIIYAGTSIVADLEHKRMQDGLVVLAVPDPVEMVRSASFKRVNP